MWYFDSWSVLDGQAFVSNRIADSIDAKATVFLSVPDLEPVPIGRISTSLRAQRACFQDGFRNSDGDEFEFENLDQVCDVIRRAFLGGGLGPVPAPVEGLPPRPFRAERGEVVQIPPPRDGGEYYDDEIEKLPQAKYISKRFEDLSSLSDRKRRDDLLLEVHRNAWLLTKHLKAFADATLLELVRANARQLHLPRPREILTEWISVLRCLGYWEGYGSWDELGIQGVAREIVEDFNQNWYVWPFDKEILFRIPCPLRREWNPHIQTLGHKLLMPLVDRDYFVVNNQLPELIPVLFCAMVVVLAPEMLVSGVGLLRPGDLSRLMGRACEWLAGEMPRVELPPAVESELTNFALRRLGMNPDRRA